MRQYKEGGTVHIQKLTAKTRMFFTSLLIQELQASMALPVAAAEEDAPGAARLSIYCHQQRSLTLAVYKYTSFTALADARVQGWLTLYILSYDIRAADPLYIVI